MNEEVNNDLTGSPQGGYPHASDGGDPRAAQVGSPYQTGNDDSQQAQRGETHYPEGGTGYGWQAVQGYGQNGQYGQGGAFGYARSQETPPENHSQPTSGYGMPYAQAAKKPKGASGGKTFLIAFAGAFVACVLVIGVSLGFGLIGGSGASVQLGAADSAAIEAEDADAALSEAVADKCLPSVVSVDVYGTTSASSGDSLFDLFYGQRQNDTSLRRISMGSGVVLSSNGYIITNNHVVDGGSAFKVNVEGNTYDAELVGNDESSDVAVLKVKDAGELTAIAFGDSDNIRIGEWVMSIGSPFGLEQSVATGIVSATSRSQIMNSQSNMLQGGSGETTIYPNMIQTDAAINPGNSGGALVNANGELIGINTLITSYSGNYSGVGFAIPSNYAINIAQSIIEGKEPTHAQLGINMATVNEQNAELYGFSVSEGAYVSGVLEGSAADAAGLKIGDIIVAFDGEDVASASDVLLDVRTKNPGDKVTLTIYRGQERQDIEITLGESTSK